MKKKNQNEDVSGILLFAKRSGITSFSSLWSIKHALGTNKVGHTGTLDSFADGLLVVLSGSLTHLVPHVTGFKKTYKAVVCFGEETDTLDPLGVTIKKSSAPTKEQVLSACKKYCGALLQVPPEYSAIHVGGKRASDMVRSGGKLELEPRQIFVYKNELLDFKPSTEKNPCSYALLEIECSKGTYIRALARDMANSLGSCAHLSALRRTSVGPFNLSDAACASLLPEFTIEHGIKLKKHFTLHKEQDSKETFLDIQNHFSLFTPSLATKCGFMVEELKSEVEKYYLNGRPLTKSMFTKLEESNVCDDNEYKVQDQIAVFYSDSQFAGIIRLEYSKLKYGFVVPHKKNDGTDLKVFSWQQIQNAEFPLAWKKQGVALSVGSFDGMHAGHAALLDAVAEQKKLVAGVIMFRQSVKAKDADFCGDVASLQQRLDFCANKKIAFAVVIDFSADFSRMNGDAFIKTLVDSCNIKFMAEGSDFKCGYKGSVSMVELLELSKKHSFELKQIDDVVIDGYRISSTRVRDAILHSDFISAQKMLLRPFEYDCSGMKWSSSSDSLYSASCVSKQIVPLSGTYSCVVSLGEEKLHTTIVVEKNTFRLILPTEHTASLVKAVVFL